MSWRDAPLSVDFEATPRADDPLTVDFRVLPGGFPRTFAEEVRFDFGDDLAGWGERISHRYAAEGVYAVELVARLEGLVLLTRTHLVHAGAARPTSAFAITVNRTPAYLNGSRPYATRGDRREHPFHLLLPSHGFTVDVLILDPSRAGELDPHFRIDGPRATWQVAEGEALPEGMTTLRAGDTSLDVEIVKLGPERDPFDRPMEWLLDFEDDLYTTTSSIGPDGAIVLHTREGANGKPDFAEELAPLGASDPRYTDWIEREIVTEIRRHYLIAPDGTPHGGIAMGFHRTTDPGAPEKSDFREDGAFSIVRFGGSLGAFLGRSRFSLWNERRVDDTAPDLGVGTARIVQLAASILELEGALDPIRPDRGTPAGRHPADAEALDPSFDRFDPNVAPTVLARHDDLRRVAHSIALAVASVAAHEMGHALGLVPDGPPPGGFFGGANEVTFVGAHTDPHHVDLPPLNLMQAGGNFLGAISDGLEGLDLPPDLGPVELLSLLAKENRLEPYSLAYLRRRQTYRSFE